MERQRMEQAIASSMQEVNQLRDMVQQRVGPEAAAAFDAHLHHLLADEALLASAYQHIEQALMSAERSLWETAGEFAEMIAQVRESSSQTGIVSAHHPTTRIVAQVQGSPSTDLRHLTSPVILLAYDLSPADIASLDPTCVLGIVTEQGGPTSHTALFARQIGIPAVVAVPDLLAALHELATPPQRIALNGHAGTVEIDPEPETITLYSHQMESYRRYQEHLATLCFLPAKTLDGQTVEMAANVGRLQDAYAALSLGAEGVGLFRTEFLFLDRESPPSEEEQLEAYLSVFGAFEGKTVIVRTLDIGGDKAVPYLHMAHESNPFLGLRGIRLCLTDAHLPLFRTQLRALLRAAEMSKAGPWIMLPMVNDLHELRRTRALLSEAEAALLHEGKLQSPAREKIRLGVMIETPAAALTVDVMAREADFFSIGTNDLTQYTLASDRINASLADLHHPFHPAVMRSVAHIVTTAHRYTRWVGACGEVAANPRATPFLVGLGIDGLSMEASSLNGVKQVIRGTTSSKARELVERVLAAESAEMVEGLLDEQQK